MCFNVSKAVSEKYQGIFYKELCKNLSTFYIFQVKKKKNSLWLFPLIFVMETTLHFAELNQTAGKRNLSPSLTSSFHRNFSIYTWKFYEVFLLQILM